MCTSRLISIVIIILFCQCITLSCKKPLPTPTTTDCGKGCCFSDSEVEFIKKLENVSVDKIGSIYLLLKDPINENQTVMVCPVDWSDFDSLATTYKISGLPPYNAPYSYRLWGTLYENLKIPPGFNPDIRNYFIKIDKIEKQ